MLPEIILFPPTSIGHAHVSSHSHRLPQALNNKSKVKFIKWKKEGARSLHSWLVGVSTSVLKEDIMSSYHHRDSLVGAEQNLSVEKLCFQPSQASDTQVALLHKRWGWQEEFNCHSWRDKWQSFWIIKHYWVLAGYKTAASPKNRITKLLKVNQFQHKRGRLVKVKVEPVKETKLEPEPEIEIIF